MARRDLPDFERPPVNEVALSVQFAGLDELRLAHLGLLWGRFKKEYPMAQEHNPLMNVVEQFEPVKSRPSSGVQISERPEARLWFLDKTGSHLIQVQRDRFVRNWRGKGEEYPRYERIRESFLEGYTKFLQFLDDENLGLPETTQVEVTYINHIFPEGVWDQPGQANRVFTVCALPGTQSRQEPEDFGFGLRYVIPDNAGKFLGRLHVSVKSGFHVKEEKQIFVMQLTARGKSHGVGLEGITSFTDLGRRWIVEQFAALTTPEMHGVWRRTDHE